jgi:hypothetical protein
MTLGDIVTKKCREFAEEEKSLGEKQSSNFLKYEKLASTAL